MPRRFSKLPHKALFAAAGAVAIVVVVLFLVFRPNNNPIIPSTNPAASANSRSGQAAQPGSGGTSASGQDQDGTPTTKVPAGTPASVSGPLIAPTGDFVSNHHPGGSAPTTEASVCNTTAGATCYIQFTNGGTVKKLTPQVTGSNGATYWYWDTRDAGLTTGSWTITAVASANGQTKSATDTQQLVVQ